jgi:hypothetical protein
MGFRGIVGMIYTQSGVVIATFKRSGEVKTGVHWVLTSQATVRAWLDDIQDDTLAHPVQ